MRLAQDNHMIDALSPDRADQPFSKTIVKSSQLHSYRLIGRKPSWSRMSFTPSTDVSSEYLAWGEDRVCFRDDGGEL